MSTYGVRAKQTVVVVQAGSPELLVTENPGRRYLVTRLVGPAGVAVYLDAYDSASPGMPLLPGGSFGDVSGVVPVNAIWSGPPAATTTFVIWEG